MKQILCYNIGKSGSVIWENMNSLVNGFRQLGREVAVCDTTDIAQVNAALELLQHPEWLWFSFGFNNFGMIAKKRDKDGNICTFFPYEKSNVPHVSIMLDVPYNFCVRGYDLPCAKHIVTMLDKNVGAYLDIAYPEKNMNKLFMPLAGTIYNDCQQLEEEKKYDVVFSASRWVDGEVIRDWHDGTTGRWMVSLLDEAADYMEAYPVNTVDAFQAVLHAHGLCDAAYMEKMLPYYAKVLVYIKMWRRYRALEMLVKNDIRVDVFGANWESVPFANKINLHGEISYKENLRVFSQAKIVFQDQAEFNNGAHDRVFTAMLNGAVVVSEYSSYLEQEFVNGEEIFLYDWLQGEKQIEVIHKLLADESWRLSIAKRAKKKTEQRHCWCNRAADIMRAVALLYGEN